MLAALQEENERPLPVLLTHQRKSQNRRGGLAVKPEMPQRPLLVKKKENKKKEEKKRRQVPLTVSQVLGVTFVSSQGDQIMR